MARKRTVKRPSVPPDELPLRLRPLTAQTAATLAEVLGQLRRAADAHEAARTPSQRKRRQRATREAASDSADVVDTRSAAFAAGTGSGAGGQLVGDEALEGDVPGVREDG